MATRYVEARGSEAWEEVGRDFLEWARARLPQGDHCGYLEAETAELGSRRFLGYSIPDRYSALNQLFVDWARQSQRLAGLVENELIIFADEPDLKVELPLSMKSIPTPPWLK